MIRAERFLKILFIDLFVYLPVIFTLVNSIQLYTDTCTYRLKTKT